MFYSWEWIEIDWKLLIPAEIHSLVCWSGVYCLVDMQGLPWCTNEAKYAQKFLVAVLGDAIATWDAWSIWKFWYVKCFFPANKHLRYGPVITQSHANLKPGHITDIGSWFLINEDKSSYTSGSGHLTFPGFRHRSNGSAHVISCQSAWTTLFKCYFNLKNAIIY